MMDNGEILFIMKASCWLFPWFICVLFMEITTLTCIPGVITYRGAKIQVISSFTDYSINDALFYKRFLYF
jgi:hypothetical protein